jgi:putative flippase GtrA
MIKFFKYILAGVLATGLNLLVLFICVNYFDIWYLLSASISFIFGLLASYSLQKYFVFENNKKYINSQLLHFFIYNILMLLFNGLLMFLFVDIFNIWYLLSQILVSIITAFINFVYFKLVIFKNR